MGNSGICKQFLIGLSLLFLSLNVYAKSYLEKGIACLNSGDVKSVKNISAEDDNLEKPYNEKNVYMHVSNKGSNFKLNDIRIFHNGMSCRIASVPNDFKYGSAWINVGEKYYRILYAKNNSKSGNNSSSDSVAGSPRVNDDFYAKNKNKAPLEREYRLSDQKVIVKALPAPPSSEVLNLNCSKEAVRPDIDELLNPEVKSKFKNILEKESAAETLDKCDNVGSKGFRELIDSNKKYLPAVLKQKKNDQLSGSSK